MVIDWDMQKSRVDRSPTLSQYRDTMVDCLSLYTDAPKEDLFRAVDYSINKRLKNPTNIKIENNYQKKEAIKSLLGIADYIASKEPIVTAHGTMFQKHGTVPNPLGTVIQLFLDKRVEDKDKMLLFPKGSEEYEKYNLFQQLDKIDCNGHLNLIRFDFYHYNGIM